MQALTQALYATLATDPAVVAGTAPYRGGPGVFSGRSAPGDAPMPYVHIRPALVDAPWDTLAREGREITQEIRAHAPDANGEGAIAALAERIRDLLHNRPLPVTGWHVALLSASGPADVPDEPGFVGRAVLIRALLQRA